MAATLTPTKDTGATTRRAPRVFVEPELDADARPTSDLLPDTGLNGPFMADMLSAALTHERCGVHLYRSVGARTANPVLQISYRDFEADTMRHVEILERTITRMGGDPQYVSPMARALEGMSSHLLESTYVLNGSIDVMAQEMVMLDAVFLAETIDHANWEQLGRLVESLPEGEPRDALAEAVGTVESEEDRHLGWAKETRSKLTMLQATSPVMTKVAAAGEELLTRVRDWLSCPRPARRPGDTARRHQAVGALPDFARDGRTVEPVSTDRRARAALLLAVIALVLWGLPAHAAATPAERAATAQTLGGCALGAPSSPGYAFVEVGSDGCPLRWDPCTVIDWWYNPTGAAAPESEVVAAVDAVAAATGLTFRHRGSTSMPVNQWLSSQLGFGTGLLVGWGSLTPGVLGQTTTQHLDLPGHTSEILRAGVVVDPARGANLTQLRAILRHEMGHVVGLDHVATPSSLMHPNLTTLSDYTAGDRNGLHLLGAAQGCVPGSIRASLVASNPNPALPPHQPPRPGPVAPLGALDAVVVEGRTVRVRGWAFDSDAPGPIGIAYGTVVMGRGGIVRIGLTGLPRPDVAQTVSPHGWASGFDLAVDLPPGEHTVCVGALDHDGVASTGGVVSLGCRQVVIK